jgi:protein involved in polysaccharide export with SLBB domain
VSPRGEIPGVLQEMGDRMNHFLKLKRKKSFLLIGGVLLMALFAGCQGTKSYVKPAGASPEPLHKVTLGPGDVIDVKFFYNPELNESQTVRPDGKIVLQLVDEVSVYGKTPAELRNELIRLYISKLKRAEIAVLVRSFYERRVYVGGEVKTPGLIPMPGRLTVLEAIMQSGGFEPKTAQVSNVVIIRHKNGKRYGGTLNFAKILNGNGEDAKPFYLEPNDIVYVPRTVIVKVNQWIDQYINKIVPRTGLTFSYPVGLGTIGLDTSTAVAVP